MNQNTSPITYLPLKNFHIVPMVDLSPENLKKAAKKTSHDREKISHNTKLNAIAKKLGIYGGFASYEEEYNEKILPFMATHGLVKRKNLLSHSKDGEYNLFFPFDRQEVSERLFYSEGETPTKIFTGYDFDFSGPISWHSQDLYDLLKQNKDLEKVIFDSLHLKKETELLTDTSDLNEKQKHLLELDVLSEIVFSIQDKSNLPSFFDYLKNPNQKVEKKYKDISIKIIDLLILNYRYHMRPLYNLLGGLLTDTNEEPVMKIYFPKDMDSDEAIDELNLYTFLQKLISMRVRVSNEGWVNVLPYNENIIFLKDGFGNYDFLIRNQRNKIFDHQIYGENLKRSDIPKFNHDYQYKRWFYFEYEGNRELERHKAEKYYYEGEGSLSNYPITNDILQDYFQATGQYKLDKRSSSTKIEGFYPRLIDGKQLMVSQLVSIDELIEFINENPDYYSYRKGESLLPVNSERDSSLPASCTYYDVLAYIKWFEEKKGIPIRPLSVSEYHSLRKSGYSTRNKVTGSDMNFFDSKGGMFEGHPPYMEEAEFDKLHLRFKNSIQYFNVEGFNFIDSDCFCEWLMEGVQIRSVSLSSFYKDKNIMRSCGPKDSTGKYKGVKTGFRLCYELA